MQLRDETISLCIFNRAVSFDCFARKADNSTSINSLLTWMLFKLFQYNLFQNFKESSQNLLTDLLLILFTVVVSTVHNSFKGTSSKALIYWKHHQWVTIMQMGLQCCPAIAEFIFELRVKTREFFFYKDNDRALLVKSWHYIILYFNSQGTSLNAISQYRIDPKLCTPKKRKNFLMLEETNKYFLTIITQKVTGEFFFRYTM